MKRLYLLSVLAMVVLGVGCSGKIPEAYQGRFADPGTGAVAVVEEDAIQLHLPNGQTLSEETWDLDLDEEFAALSAGESGLVVRELKYNDKILEVFWVRPNKSTRHFEQGLIWFDEAEIFYTKLDLRYEDEDRKAPDFKLTYSPKGQLLLDTVEKTVQKGWGKERFEYQLRRAD